MTGCKRLAKTINSQSLAARSTNYTWLGGYLWLDFVEFVENCEAYVYE